MKISDLKIRVLEIAANTDPSEALREIKSLATELTAPRVKRICRGNWIYSYLVRDEYDPTAGRSREVIVEKLGRVSK